MKRIVLFIVFIIGITSSASELKIKIVGDEWGKAGKKDLHKVLKSAADAIWKYCPDIQLPPIQVGNSKDSPISLFKRAKNGDLQVKLTSKDLFWAQHAYQFAHEVGHCLCRFKKGDRANMWFEESVCEASSLFVLREMSKEWKTNPPYPHWKNYSKALFDYSERLLIDEKRSLPKGLTLGQWFRNNRDYLVANWTDRKKNAVVAKELLKLVEKDPFQWQSFYWINEKRTDEKISFENYLENWRKAVPEKHKKFVLRVKALFEIKE